MRVNWTPERTASVATRGGGVNDTPPLCFLPKSMNLLHLAIGIPGKILITAIKVTFFFAKILVVE